MSKNYTCQNGKKCGDYGDCYNNTQYCDKTKKVQTCFPSDIKYYDRREWCRNFGEHNVSLMRDQSCTFACIVEFDLINGEET